jgi:transcriptional regulator with XRE-family HTH domain
MAEERPRAAFAGAVGKRIATIRAARGISQEELGFRAEMHRTNVGQLERGERVPRLDSATKIASALGVSVDVLVEEIDWKPPALRAGGFAYSKCSQPK